MIITLMHPPPQMTMQKKGKAAPVDVDKEVDFIFKARRGSTHPPPSRAAVDPPSRPTVRFAAGSSDDADLTPAGSIGEDNPGAHRGVGPFGQHRRLRGETVSQPRCAVVPLCCGASFARRMESHSSPFSAPVQVIARHDEGWAEYPTVEHAFLACATSSTAIRDAIRLSDTVKEAREVAQNAPPPKGWDRAAEVATMERLVRDKVRRHKQIRELLVSTDKLTIKVRRLGVRVRGVRLCSIRARTPPQPCGLPLTCAQTNRRFCRTDILLKGATNVAILCSVW